MLSLTGGELAMVLFIFALTWGAGWLPRVAERWGQRSAERRSGGGSRGAPEPRRGG